MSVPFTRTLPYVLREQLQDDDSLRLVVGKVVSVPDARHVVVLLRGTNVTVPRLKSYAAPAANEPVYLLVGPSLLLAIGTVQ